MNYFKHPLSGQVYAYDDSQTPLVGLHPMTETEVFDHLNPVIPITIPTVVTMRQARRVLHELGFLAKTQEVLKTMDGPQGEAARIDWEFATEVSRDWPLVTYLSDNLGLTSEQTDNLFIKASTY